MRILIDTNIVLDVLCNRTEFVNDSMTVFKLCETKRIKGYISTLSIANLVYIMRKELNMDKISQLIEKLSLIFEIVDLKSDDLKKATKLKFKDYEDAVQSIQAKRIKATYIITRNIKDFKNSTVPAINTKELISISY